MSGYGLPMPFEYARVYAQLRDRILAGEFELGQKLPSIADLQQAYDIRSLNTVRSALAMLQDDGMIRTEQGRGSYVVSTESSRTVDVREALSAASEQLQRARKAIDAQLTGAVLIDLHNADIQTVILGALDLYEDQCRQNITDAHATDAAERDLVIVHQLRRRFLDQGARTASIDIQQPG